VPDAPTTLLVEDLRGLVRALPDDLRLPVIECIVARGRRDRIRADSPNHLRYELLGLDAPQRIPVAALTRASNEGEAPPVGSVWLRADPVTLRADMVRVFTVAHGYQGCDEGERAEIDRIVREAFAHAGFTLADDASAPWCLSLDGHLGFDFLPLPDTLGRDVADALPDDPAAAAWKRLMTEIQVDLHQSTVNVRRRQRGLPEINSVWFWGAGAIGTAESPGNRAGRCTVVSDDPVSRGLAVVENFPLHGQSDLAGLEPPANGAMLVDWVMPSNDVHTEATALEAAARHLLARTGRGIQLVDGNGNRWAFGPRFRWRFWKRIEPLRKAMDAEGAV